VSELGEQMMSFGLEMSKIQRDVCLGIKNNEVELPKSSDTLAQAKEQLFIGGNENE